MEQTQNLENLVFDETQPINGKNLREWVEGIDKGKIVSIFQLH